MKKIFVVIIGTGLLVGSVTLFGCSREEEKPVTQEDVSYIESADQLPNPVGGLNAIVGRVKYPETAKKDGLEGTVYVEVFVSETGAVDSVRVQKGVREDLDMAAVAALEGVTFEPGLKEGKPAKVKVIIPVRFRLGS